MVSLNGNRLYRCRAKVLYKFFNTNLGVVFDEKYIQDLSISLGWDPNNASMNSETTQSANGIMSFTGSGNSCNVTITDPFFTGVTWPALLDVAGAAIGNRSYQSGKADGRDGILRRKCNEGETPEQNDCWDYELIDIANWIPTNNANAQISNSRGQYDQPAMIMISLWYEAYNGYTFGTDYLFRLSGSSAGHGKEYPTVTLNGQGNFGITFQDRLVNVSIDNELEVEKALAELAARNNFNMEFCVADYDNPDRLDRRVLKSNITIKQLLDDIVKNKRGGNYLSLPTKDMYNTLHVCTRADTWPGCSVFYLGKPLYEGFKVSAVIDSSMVGRNLEYGQNVDGTSRADGGSDYLPSLDQKDSVWEVILPKEKNIHGIKSVKYSNKTLDIEFKDSQTSNPIRGTWEGFKSSRNKYFTSYNEKVLILEKKTDKLLEKKSYQKVNPGYIGEFEEKAASIILSGRITEVNDLAEGNGKSISARTDFVLYLRGMTSNLVSKLNIFADLSLFEADSGVEKGYEVKMGASLGKTSESKKQNLSYYVILQNSKVFIDPFVALTMSAPETYDPGVPNVPESGVPENKTAPLEGAAESKFVPSRDITPEQLKKIPNSALKPLQDLISSGEGGTESINVVRRDSEGVRRGGSASTFSAQFGKSAASTSLEEIRKRQNQNGTVNGLKEIGAVGYPQFIGDTLEKAIQYSGLPLSTKFSRSTQDSLLKYLLFVKRPEIGAYLMGASGATKEEAAQGLAREFASFSLTYAEAPGPQLRASGTDPKTTAMEDPDKKRPAGSSLYAGVAGNRAKISSKKAQDVLTAVAKNLRNANISTSTINYLERGTGEGEEEDSSTASLPLSTAILKFKWPMSGLITSHKGSRWGRLHAGIDISAPIGTEIYAAGPGVVSLVRNQSEGYGHWLEIKHGDSKYSTRYAHLNAPPLVSVGQIVGHDTLLGYSGNSGRSTGPHLHFEIRFDNTPLSPDVTHQNTTSVGREYRVTRGSDTNLHQPGDNVRINLDGVSISPGGQSNSNTGQNAPGGGTGFNIDTEFKGVPRALRILPKFTILSFVGLYQAWLKSDRQIGIDPGVWLPEYFKNWLIKTVQFNWTQGDLRVKINASSVFGINNSQIVPSWESYSYDLSIRGKYSKYVDYIRAYGDLCWNDNGKPSCHTRCAVTEEMMLNGTGDPTILSSANVSSIQPCQLEPGKLSLSDEDQRILFQIVAAEATAKDGKIGHALVARAIFNRILYTEKLGANYGSNGSSKLKDIVYARNGVEFEPVRNGRIDEDFSNKASIVYDGIQLAFDHEALIQLGINKEILASPNFVNLKSYSNGDASWWGEAGNKYGGHWFGRDSTARRWTPDQSIQEFYSKFGKCTRTGPSVSELVGCVPPPEGGWRYISKKSNKNDWSNRVSTTERVKKIALTAGHRNLLKKGAPGERDYTPIVTLAIASALRNAGYEVSYLDPSKSDKMSLQQVLQWLKDRKSEGFYAVEIHLDIYNGRSGIIPPLKEITIYDLALSKEFGAFNYNWRPGEIGATQKYNVSILEVAGTEIIVEQKGENPTPKSDEIRNAAAQEIAKRFVSALSC